MTPATLGSDTCGSLRIPATFCGISTIKPTHGRIPIAGVFPLAPTLDHVGPMARTVADCAALLTALAEDGAEPSAHMPPPPAARHASHERPARPEAARRADDRPYRPPAVTAESEARVMAGLDSARWPASRSARRVVQLDAPQLLDWDDLSADFLAEIWAGHAQYADSLPLYRPAVRKVVEVSRNFSDAQAYMAVQARRAWAAAQWEAWFAEHGVDVVLEATLPIGAPVRGPGYDEDHTAGAGDPLIALTVLWDMVGFPVAALPVADTGPMPVGVSVVAPRGAEAIVTQVAIDLQEHALGLPDWPV